jgi:glycerol uptake facilitator protein
MSTWLKRAGLGGELIAEFFGTMVLILFGDGVVATVLLFMGFGPSSSASWVLINFGWGFAVMLGVFVAGAISGAHLNPAVTVGLAVNGTFPWNKVIPYIVAQVVGAFVAAAILFANYTTGFEGVNGSPVKNATTNIFFTFPHTTLRGNVVPVGWAFFDQVLGTFLLVFLILAIVDARAAPPLSNLAPLIIGFLVVAIGMSFGANAGYAINPARDFGPRLFAWIAGWGAVAFPGNGIGYSNYWWVPIVAPLIGGALAAIIYRFTIGPVLADRAKEAQKAA